MAGTNATDPGRPTPRADSPRRRRQAKTTRSPRPEASPTLELNPDFEDLLVALSDCEANFVVVGAHAVAFHGAARATSDLDILIRPSLDNARAVVHALRRCGAPVEADKLAVTDIARMGILYDMVAPNRHVDLLTEISGLTYDEVSSTSAAARVRSRRVQVIGWDALVKNKRITGRLKDLVDIQRLEWENIRRTDPEAFRTIIWLG